ncbi:MAG: hypothetical protein AB9866_27805 [Syntrophobacteraceae bacterium]
MSRVTEGTSMLTMKTGSDYYFQHKEFATSHIWAWLSLAVFLGAVFVTCAIFYVWLYVQQVQNGYRLSRIYEELELHGTVQRKLTLEWSRFGDPYRLEEIGRNRFQMAPPRHDQQIFIR